MIITPAYALNFPAVARATAGSGGTTQQAATLTANSPNITNLISTAALKPGMTVYGPNIPPGAVIVSILSGTSLSINQNVPPNAITGTYLLTFPAGYMAQGGTLTASSNVIVTSAANLIVGSAISGAGLAVGTVITSINGPNSITVSNTASLSGTETLYFPASGMLTQLIQAAQSAMENYCGFPFEVKTSTEYYSGNSYPDLILRRPWISAVASVAMDNISGGCWGQFQLTPQTGAVLTQNSTTVTGLTTAGMAVGQMVIDASLPGQPGSVIPTPCWIATIVNGTTITLTSAALKSATQTIYTTGCFGMSQQLVYGTQYAAVFEGISGSLAKHGMLRFAPYGGSQGWGTSLTGGWSGYGGGYGRSYLTPVGNRSCGWPMGQGNVQVVYTTGWTGLDGGPIGLLTPTIPLDLCQCCVELVMWMALNTPYGGLVLSNESLGKYSYGLGAIDMAQAASCAIAGAGPLGSIRSILGRYRLLSV